MDQDLKGVSDESLLAEFSQVEDPDSVFERDPGYIELKHRLAVKAAAREEIKKFDLSDDNPDKELISKIYWVSSVGGDVEYLKKSLALGADPNEKRENGRTALMGAAANGNAECVKALIDAGADLNAVDDDGMTALMLASASKTNYSGQVNSVKYLLDAGADYKIKSKKGFDALFLSVQSPGCLNHLINVGADVNTKYEGGWTPIMLAADQGNFVPFTSFKLLLDAGADYDAVSDNGLSPLILAARKETPLPLILLLNAGANPNKVRDADGRNLSELVEESGCLLCMHFGVDKVSIVRKARLRRGYFF